MVDTIMNQTKDKMKQAVQAFSKNLATVRAGRANPSLLDSVYVDYYGASTPLNQLASVSAPEARLLVITPYDKSAISDVEKAIQKADLGLSPSSDGNVIRINIPALTEERRRDLVKVVGKFAEESRVQIRNVRRDSNDQLKKDSDLPEDDLRSAQDDVQKLTDQFIAEVDQLAKEKEKEILEV
ncbi:ribosome recycling factor [Virgibacillus halodenitrificans]|uniref:Ribosome-recycling factor n=1 Tax=Virgibacillus halodenitrificans TaxID=1482 RepID=A0AAC9IZV7_VIRHA|nr:ribosome recycling factor [Virgibacillus halodenitrificans]APC48602.1 ribosome recycling factor [Virgibacillus halodenitrificans]MBD1224195.1 ribosome recycling factor [Virgibacillus halodenitrificans]MCG1028730.1 ribosome recycling factor [Virgibacillus halodenitrificans]MCJ0931176.1 ribosome recycling factor [Virgibacillus halodenitrificans]MEC2160329.1 ribosome recycling factor [Virgibacillus halodenitrificans]